LKEEICWNYIWCKT